MCITMSWAFKRKRGTANATLDEWKFCKHNVVSTLQNTRETVDHAIQIGQITPLSNKVTVTSSACQRSVGNIVLDEDTRRTFLPRCHAVECRRPRAHGAVLGGTSEKFHQFLGWWPSVMDRGPLRVLLKCGHHVAPPVPRKGETPKETTQGVRGARGTQKSPPRLRTLFPLLCVHLCLGLPHRKSCKLSCGFSQCFVWGSMSRGSNVPAYVGVRDVSGFHCPEATDYQFWGWCPLHLQEPLQCSCPEGEFIVDIRFHDLRHYATHDCDTASDTRSLILAKVLQYHQACTTMTMKSGNSRKNQARNEKQYTCPEEHGTPQDC